MSSLSLASQSAEFLAFLEQWMDDLPVYKAGEVFAAPRRAAVVSVDVINGFCFFGPLASPRVAAIVDPIARLFTRAWDSGVRDLLLTQDTHEPDAVEFGQFPPHCVRGSAESEPVDAFKALPFFDAMVILEKNSISSGLNTGLDAWLDAHPETDTFVVVGDCTDLCTYQLAMHLRLDANARQLRRRVIVPRDCVDTYDRPVEAAQREGGLPHAGDLLHAVFLYHMALNGVEVAAAIH